MSDRPKDDPRAPLRVVRGGAGEVQAASDALTRPLAATVEDDELAPPTPEELLAAAALRDALLLPERGGEGAALRAAFAPATLSHEDHERLLERVLGADASASSGSSAPGAVLSELTLSPAPTRAEERAASTLRARVDDGLRPDPDAEPDDEVERLVEVAVALRSAHAPRAIPELAEARIRKGALASPRSRFRTLATTVAALAVAAAAAFAILPRTGLGRAPATASLVPSRSTQELFDPAEPFPREGGASERIDRISAARSADLRQNRFARWGVK